MRTKRMAEPHWSLGRREDLNHLPVSLSLSLSSLFPLQVGSADKQTINKYRERIYSAVATCNPPRFSSWGFKKNPNPDTINVSENSENQNNAGVCP